MAHAAFVVGQGDEIGLGLDLIGGIGHRYAHGGGAQHAQVIFVIAQRHGAFHGDAQMVGQRGQGSALGVFLGALTIAIIGKSLSLVGLDVFWQTALKGIIILVAVVINILVQRNAARKALEGRDI